MLNHIIGLHGKARSGKDTAAEIMVGALKDRGIPTMTVAFAKPMKDFIHDIMVPGMPGEDYVSDEWREKDLADYGWPDWTLRKMWQTFGTESIRNVFGEDVWVRALTFGLKNAPPVGNVFIVTDTRFPNEIDYMKNEFGENYTSIKILRDGADGAVGVEGHESEAYDLDTEHTINNNSSLADLKINIDMVLHKYFRGHGIDINEQTLGEAGENQIVTEADERSLQSAGAGGVTLS